MKKINDNYRLIFYYLGIFLIMIGIIQFIPLVVLPFYQEEIKYAYCFIIPGTTSVFLGYLISSLLKDTPKKNLEKHQDSILVVLIWILAILVSSIPFLLTKQYNFTQSVFEITSGYSTTGLTIVNAEECPHIFLFFRSLTLFIGGIGLVLILTCAISDKYGLRLYNAEGHSDKLLPNLAKSARLILSIYAGYILLGTIAYVICGMTFFDALNHSISALSTGGFSTKAESILYYHSLPIEIITMVLMLLGSTNFLVHLALIRRKYKAIWHHNEVKLVFILILIVTPIMIVNLMTSNFETNNIFKNLRISIFQLISCLTTTGFQNVSSMNIFPCGFITLMILLMIIGGGLGSTAGGIKQYRIVVVIKGMISSIKESFSSKKVIKTNFIEKAGSKEVLTKDEVHNCMSYALVYLSILFIGTFILTCFGFSLQDSLFEFTSALSTDGLSVGITSFNANPIILWTLTIGMFLGRLEIFVVIQALIRIYYDMRKRVVI